MKYIIAEYMGIETPIIFEDILDHCFIAQAFNPTFIVSAGFVRVYGDDHNDPNTICAENIMRVSVFGESTTLNKKSRPEDKEIIFNALHRHYN